MKALANAEKEKNDKVRPEKAQKSTSNEALIAKVDNISPFPSVINGKPLLLSQASTMPQSTQPPQQQAAANVFSAARLPESYFVQVLWGLGFVTVALMIWLGLQFFPANLSSTQLLVAENNLKPATQPENALPPLQEASAPTVKNPATLAQASRPQKSIFLPTSSPNNQAVEDNHRDSHVTSPAKPQISSTDTPDVDKQSFATLQRTDLQLTLKKTGSTVEPALLSAYEAFQQDDLSQAQQLYRQVLRNDVRNIDALLGMAAIAQKQGRNLDAIGWYQKVLALEPTHAMALAATVELQPTTDKDGQLSYIKNLIAQQPENAHLHAALGNLYAEKNRWQEAQSAYFEAVKFSPQSAELVFNLAVSLEHLNQPQLAIVQYQRALQLVERTGAISPDAQSIKNRMAALQPSP